MTTTVASKYGKCKECKGEILPEDDRHCEYCFNHCKDKQDANKE